MISHLIVSVVNLTFGIIIGTLIRRESSREAFRKGVSTVLDHNKLVREHIKMHKEHSEEK